ncbi:MAG: hypothetical protein ACQEUD_07340 [Bacillota bacterium]
MSTITVGLTPSDLTLIP